MATSLAPVTPAGAGVDTEAAPPRSPRALVWHSLGIARRDLLTAAALFSSHQFGEAMVPVIIGATIGDAIAGHSGTRLLWWMAILAADFALLSLSYRFGARASVRARERTAHRLRLWISHRAVHPAGGADLAPGDLLTRASSDTLRVGSLTSTIAHATAAAGVLIVATALLIRSSLILGLVIPVGTAILLTVIGRVSRRLRRHSAAEQRGSAQATVLAEDLIRGLRVLKGIGAEPQARADYTRASRSALRAAQRAVSSGSALDAVTILLTGIYLAVIAGIGGWLTLSGRLGLGELVAALGLAQFLIGPLDTLSDVTSAYARALASATRLHSVLCAPPAVHSAAATVPGTVAPDAEVTVESVSAGEGRFLSFRAAGGQLTGVAVNDPAVAGRIPALLAREIDPPGGRILLGGIRIEDWPLGEWRAHVVVSAHDAALTGGTVAEAIATLAPDEAAAALGTWAAFADQAIAALPNHERTDVGERGQNLSGGQRQRIALARAIASRAPVLVLHDPTTAVDAATEDRIADRLRTARSGRTTIIVTTSPALLARCDQVIHLAARDTETGTHEQLMRASDGYRNLVAR